jgi:hypothetical protein
MEQMNIKKAHGGASKPQLGWRGPNADELLYTPLFKFGYHERIHLVKYGEVGTAWDKFVDDVFEKQDGFVHKKELKGSVKSIKDQWIGRIDQFKREFGWEDGKCKT